MKAAGAAVAALAIILGAAVAVDERYAHASDLRQISSQIEINRLSSEILALEMRRAALEDKVYDGAARTRGIKKPDPAEQTILQRYSNELRDLDGQIRDKRRTIEALKTGTKK